MKIKIEQDIDGLRAIRKMRYISGFAGRDREWNQLVSDSVAELEKQIGVDHPTEIDGSRLIEQLQTIVHKKIHPDPGCACGPHFTWVTNMVIERTYSSIHNLLKKNRVKTPADFTYLLEELSGCFCHDCSDLLNSGACLGSLDR